jgi:hypothetical protein
MFGFCPWLLPQSSQNPWNFLNDRIACYFDNTCVCANDVTEGGSPRKPQDGIGHQKAYTIRALECWNFQSQPPTSRKGRSGELDAKKKTKNQSTSRQGHLPNFKAAKHMEMLRGWHDQRGYKNSVSYPSPQ